MAEIAFERLLLVRESTRGTAVNPPTRYAALTGTITPQRTWYRAEESDGTLAEFTRAKPVRAMGEWEAEGAADVYILPLYLNALLKGGVTSPTTPSGATNSRLWSFPRTLTADSIDTLTMYNGDPNVQEFQASYAFVDELTLEADATGEDGVTMSVSGMSKFPSKTAASSTPAQLTAPLLIPGNMQLWLDSASAIGTTEITGRVLRASVTLRSGAVAKWAAQGPTNDLSFTRLGRQKVTHEMELEFELLDTAQYDLFVGDTANEIKARLRFNGPLIESGFYHYINVDMYGGLTG